MKDQTSLEETVARNQLVALCTGIIVVMALAWITLPTEEDRVINRECAQKCIKLVGEERGELSIFKAPTFFDEMGRCHTACTKNAREKNGKD
tara:strand:- start:612 stop:887 length:276 start_codon:yes stop_codon:yes gene_type:complete